ncbi:MAG TPA: YbgC/FadM family acyl-CoA thioesterase [Chitinivibrionales bacterium]|nr:YbgC/FadM family acyl-CoA thioesterase [Chitinivibrionales bacterium]
MKSPVNHIKIRIYYEDTDCGDVVYYANYLNYMERGRTELLRDMGFELSDLHKQGTLFVVAESHLKYHFPARYNDVLDVATSIAVHSSVTLTFHYEIRNQKGVLCVSGDVTAACVDGKGKVKRMPKEILEKLK